MSADNVVKLPLNPRRVVRVTIYDFGGTFSLHSEGEGFKDQNELHEYLRTAFGSWCRAKQDEWFENHKIKANAEIDALPWYRRIFKQRFT